MNESYRELTCINVVEPKKEEVASMLISFVSSLNKGLFRGYARSVSRKIKLRKTWYLVFLSLVLCACLMLYWFSIVVARHYAYTKYHTMRYTHLRGNRNWRKLLSLFWLGLMCFRSWLKWYMRNHSFHQLPLIFIICLCCYIVHKALPNESDNILSLHIQFLGVICLIQFGRRYIDVKFD